MIRRRILAGVAATLMVAATAMHGPIGHHKATCGSWSVGIEADGHERTIDVQASSAAAAKLVAIGRRPACQ